MGLNLVLWHDRMLDPQFANRSKFAYRSEHIYLDREYQPPFGGLYEDMHGLHQD